MAIDLSVEMIHATVQLEQPQGDGTRAVGTGFLVSAPTPDGKPRTVLVTAAHVLENMPGAEMRIGYRAQTTGGSWAYEPQKVTIRIGRTAQWVKNPTRDVAALVIEAPEDFARAAIPLAWIADTEAFAKQDLAPGAEMMALGFPKGLAANAAGFPILRVGRLASWPVGPSAEFPTFLLDFSVFPGNSGGPVFVRNGAADRLLVTGLITQQVELTGERLEIGVVTQASYIRETVALLDAPESATIHAVRMTPALAAPRQAFSAVNAAAQVSK